MQNKNLLIQRVRDKTNLPLDTVGQVVNTFLYELNHALLRQEKVLLTHVGVFTVVRRKPKLARNPKTGETVQVPSRLRIKFKESKIIRSLLNDKAN
jgi:nucleoid DNA-binding protein